MPSDSPGSISSILDAVVAGVPILLIQFVASIALLAIGVTIYLTLTPFHERTLMARGNVAAGVVFAGAVVALGLPIAAILGTSNRLLDIVVWGVVAVVLQLLTLGALSLILRNLRAAIDAGNVAAALGLASGQIAVGLLNAAAMIPA
jgi:putative membrane protein